MTDLTRRLKHVYMISLGEDFALCTHELIEATCYANGKAAHGPCEVLVIFRLHNEMDMIALHGIIDDPTAQVVSTLSESARDGSKSSGGAQVPNMLLHSHGDV